MLGLGGHEGRPEGAPFGEQDAVEVTVLDASVGEHHVLVEFKCVARFLGSHRLAADDDYVDDDYVDVCCFDACQRRLCFVEDEVEGVVMKTGVCRRSPDACEVLAAVVLVRVLRDRECIRDAEFLLQDLVELW